MKIAVIGSGIGGLAIAIRLAVKGHEVTVFEKNSVPGGKLGELHVEGYRFDTGPSLFTLPDLVKELFTLCGENIEEYLSYSLLENNCRYFFSDGMVFNFYHDKEKLKEEVLIKTREKPATIFRRLERSKEVYNLGAPVFVFSSFHKLRNFNTPPYRNMVFKLHKFDFFRTMHQANRKEFKDARLTQLFDRYATYNGSSPYKAPATLNMIAHLENNIGAFFPHAGMYAIVRSIYELALRKNVKFRFNTFVEEIRVTHGIANGIKTKSEMIEFDSIVSDVDVKQVAYHLIKEYPLKKRLQRLQPSSSALIFYWGVNRKYDELDLHNILFSSDYKTEFKNLFQERTIFQDPTVYLFISSKLVKEDAPAGCENWFVMVNAPSDSGQDWKEIIEETRKNIIYKINKYLHTDIENHIVVEKVGSPLTIEENTGSIHGALYGISSNSMFSAFLRHPNFLSSIANLFFVGGSAHPGGGIPLCLASAKIVENEFIEKSGGASGK